MASAGTILAIALADWWTTPYVSLGFLYLFPVMLAAGFLSRPALVSIGIGCALLSEAFSSLGPNWRFSRLILEMVAFAGCGLFVSELFRNRRLSLATQARLRALVETSPAAIVTLDQWGVVELANRAAAELMAPGETELIGQSVARFLPGLQNTLRPDNGAQFRASMQCQGHRANGEPFVADVWFSTYREQGAPKLAAIIVDVTEERPEKGPSGSATPEAMERPNLNNRQIAVLQLVFEGLSNSGIEARLEMTPSAVKNTLQQLFWKTGASNRSQLVRIALERYRDLL